MLKILYALHGLSSVIRAKFVFSITCIDPTRWQTKPGVLAYSDSTVHFHATMPSAASLDAASKCRGSVAGFVAGYSYRDTDVLFVDFNGA